MCLMHVSVSDKNIVIVYVFLLSLCELCGRNYWAIRLIFSGVIRTQNLGNFGENYFRGQIVIKVLF